MNRRDFLRSAGAVGAFAAGPAASAQNGPRGSVTLVADPSDPVVGARPVQWALVDLTATLTAAGFTVRRTTRAVSSGANGFSIIASGATVQAAASVLKTAGVSPPSAPESLALVPTGTGGRDLLVCGRDARGLMYGLLELGDRVRFAADPAASLAIPKAFAERPANPVRCVMRQFTSELLDKPWFQGGEMWPAYFSTLAANRFNRFHLAFGLGYDSLQRVADSYFLFLYPFLVAVPGYNVRATNLTDRERDMNLSTLRFISEQAVSHGIDFELGVWMHGYLWPNSPNAQNTIEGLTPETHARYCRDALTEVLRACPAISSVALRIHGESGIPEGSYDFWRTIFDGVKNCGRSVEIDLHAKGIDFKMIDGALATGMPVNVSPKYWAEHQGMPYHQAAIRDLEMPVAGHTGAGLMSLSEGSLVYTRYGYADLLRDDRKYTVRHRVFSGTQRLLLWGDPQWAAAYSRAFQFCGSAGADLMEPLTCRGRRGTGVPGARTGYIDPKLEPRWDWQKYAYWYRVWGRSLYNPGADPQVFKRAFGESPQAAALQSGLASASRILPVVTTAHLPSAACDAYWPEIYWNQPLVSEARPNPYTDSPAPRTFQNVSPLDPQLFSRISDFAAELLGGERTGKYSPLEAAQWIDDLAAAAAKDLAAAGAPARVELSRAAIDVAMQVDLGRFFAAKLRCGVLYAIHERTGDRAALEEALKAYRAARAAWVSVTARAKGVYAADLSASDKISERGQWSDRLSGIDQDIAAMEQRLASAKPATDARVSAAVKQALGRPRRDTPACRHQAPAKFQPGRPVSLSLTVESPGIASARLHYRHVNQAERYQTAEMERQGGALVAQIPGAYTGSQYPLQYYFELRGAGGEASLYPGFDGALIAQPYFVVTRG